MARRISKEKLEKVVRRHIKKHYGSLSMCSAHFGEADNFMNRCFSGERDYPKALLSKLGKRGFRMNKEKVYYWIEKEDE